MTLDEIMQAIDALPPDEWVILREYMDRREEGWAAGGLLGAETVTPESLMETLTVFSDGLTDEEFAELERAVNEEYFEADDDDDLLSPDPEHPLNIN